MTRSNRLVADRSNCSKTTSKSGPITATRVIDLCGSTARSFMSRRAPSIAEARQNRGVKRDAAIAKYTRALGKPVLLIVLALFLIKLFLKSGLLLDNPTKIFEDETLCFLVARGTVGIHSAAAENVSQKDEPLVVSRIANPFQKIIQPRLHDRIVEVVHRDDPRLTRERSAEQEQVYHGIERALLQTRTNDVILVLSPSLPLAFIRIL